VDLIMGKRRVIGIVGLLPAVIITAAGLFAPGCGPSGPEMGRVSGRVTYKGEPLTQGTISFVPTDPARRSGNSRIRSDGRYDLQTAEPGDGAEVGEYRVIISGRDAKLLDQVRAPGEPVKLETKIPEKYEKADQSGLTATVKSGSNERNFDLE
jgi:hypothetical protein